MTENEREHLKAALRLAIREQREYESRAYGYTGDSGTVGAWVELLAKLEKGDDL